MVSRPVCEAFTEMKDGVLRAMLPIRTVSEANSSEHWREKHKRHKLQKGMVHYMIRPYGDSITLPCVVSVTRYAPRKLDKQDNLPMSMKYLVDAICEVLTGDYRPGRADGDARIEIVYGQVASKKYGVLVEIKPKE